MTMVKQPRYRKCNRRLWKPLSAVMRMTQHLSRNFVEKWYASELSAKSAASLLNRRIGSFQSPFLPPPSIINISYISDLPVPVETSEVEWNAARPVTMLWKHNPHGNSIHESSDVLYSENLCVSHLACCEWFQHRHIFFSPPAGDNTIWQDIKAPTIPMNK